MLKLFGPGSQDIVESGDADEDRRMREEFTTRARAGMRVETEPGNANRATLVVGDNNWPFPIPLVRRDGRWHFDGAQGRMEVLARRIGRHELAAIDVCRGYVEAQMEYAVHDRDANGVLEYAQKIISTPGEHDGLYWAGNTEGDESPIGEIVAKAIAEGYTNKHDPYHGYYFRVLTAQGPNAPGGAMSYLDNGLMTKGFALLAWPSNYGSTGIMTFVVDRTGIVYQKDLGRKTSEIAAGYTTYDPDKTWTPVSDTKIQSALR